MSDDNLYPLEDLIRAEIELEMVRASAKDGKHHFELLAIVNSWGDTMDDKEVLAAFCRLNKAGSICEHITDRG